MKWFKHLDDARKNQKVKFVCKHLGPDAGYARIFKLYEILAQRWEKRTDEVPRIKVTESLFNFEFFSSELEISVSEVKKTFKILAEAGIIDRAMWRRKILYIPKLAEHSDRWFSSKHPCTGPGQGLARNCVARSRSRSRIEGEAEGEEKMRKDKQEPFRILCVKAGFRPDHKSSDAWEELDTIISAYGEKAVNERFERWLTENQGERINNPIRMFVLALPTLMNAPGLTAHDEELDKLAMKLYTIGGSSFSGKALIGLSELRDEFSDRDIIQAWEVFVRDEGGSNSSFWAKKFADGSGRIIIRSIREDNSRRMKMEEDAKAAIEQARVEDTLAKDIREKQELSDKEAIKSLDKLLG
jgi:hypothetical protein